MSKEDKCPECGYGRLSYEEVRPILVDNLNDRFSIITFGVAEVR